MIFIAPYIPHLRRSAVSAVPERHTQTANSSSALFRPESSPPQASIAPVNDSPPPLVEQIRSGPCQVISSRKAGGVIILGDHSAEFAGPGAVVATPQDHRHCKTVIPLGTLVLVTPKSVDEILTGYRIRLQWLKLISRSTSLENNQLRAQKILDQFEQFFRSQDVQRVPDEVLAQLVGVLPQTIHEVRKKKQKVKLIT